MSRQPRGAPLLAAVALLATAATGLAAGVKLTPVKGATYAGLVRDEPGNREGQLDRRKGMRRPGKLPGD
jgi:hypothetical protein